MKDLFRIISHRFMKDKRKSVSTLAFIITFVMVYTLIMPAVALERRAAENEPGIALEETVSGDAMAEAEPVSLEAEATPAEEAESEDEAVAAEESAAEKIEAESDVPAAAPEAENNVVNTGSKTADTSAAVQNTDADVDEGSLQDADTENGSDGNQSAADSSADPSVSDANNTDAEEGMPAQKFEQIVKFNEIIDEDGNTVEKQVKVKVDAEGNAFPAGTVMKAEVVLTNIDPQRLQDMEDAIEAAVKKAAGESGLSADDTRVVQYQAIDINFFNKEGQKIQPVKKVEVRITSDKIREIENPVLVHVNENDKTGEIKNAEVIEKKDISIIDEKPDTVENNENTMLFKTGRFSPFVIVESETVDENGKTVNGIEDGSGVLMTSDGDYNVTVTYDANANIPANAELQVKEIKETSRAYKNYMEEAKDVLEDDAASTSINYAKIFDVDIVSDGKVVTPEAEVDVDIAYKNSEKIEKGTVVQALQFGEGTPAVNDDAFVYGDETHIDGVQMKAAEIPVTAIVGTGKISTNILTADGERFQITVTYNDDAKIPEGAVLVAEEIPEGSEKYEQYMEETTEKWEEDDKEGYISFARFFDIEIQKDGRKIEPETAVEVEIEHEDGLQLFNDESFSVIHFAEDGTEFIDELHLNETGTEVFYNQDSFSVIGTVSTVKDSGWPTANGQYVLVLQDGDDYYALKQDGTLKKVRYFNGTVSFIGEGTTTTDYINDYLWYVVSSGNRGKISDEYTEYNATPAGQTFIDPNSEGIFSGTSRQLQIRDGKIFCNGQLPGTSGYTQVTLTASGGQLSRVALTSDSASPMFFAEASSFTANDNETDLFTQEEVESIISKWKEQKTQESSCDKTAEVYDYENRIYQVDITASSSDYEVSPSIALEFVVDASRSMFFPTSLTQVGTFSGTNASNVRDWINSNGNRNQVYFVIQNKNGAATQFAIFYDPNSSYQYWNGYYNETRYGQWLWCDASVYNPPDDIANGGPKNSRQSGSPLSTWSYGNMDDGKIYTTGITGTSNGSFGERKTWVSRIEYLKQCVRVASQVVYAVDDNAQIGLIGFNQTITDYGTYGKSEQATLLDKINNVSLDGGTNHEGGLEKAVEKYNKNTSYYDEHYAGRKHVVVLVTDGAPNYEYENYDASRTTPEAHTVTWTSIGKVADKLRGLKDDFGHNTELYTMGLSLSNVGTNQNGLFGIASGSSYRYAAEDAAQIINAVTKIVDSIFVQANLVADVKDVIDPAFYPVNKVDGRPLAENDWINLSGTKVNAGANDAAGQIKKDSSTGNWYVEWKDQNIDWPTTDSHGAITEPGWHGTVFVKAKEDFLGGNGISTNAEGSQFEAKKYIVRGETEQHDLPQGDHTTSFETPYVNVDELYITKNDTEWTVYLGTNVDPLTEIKALWEKVKVKEVVTKTDSDHRMSSDGSLTYQYSANTNDNRDETNGREEFSISDLGITLTADDWADLIAGNSKTFDYSAYDHSIVGTILVSLTQVVKSGEKDLSESPHDTTITGDEVEKYTLTVSYRPKGANITNWHTGSYGSGMAGSRAGNITKDNTHIINVYVKGLQITKVDLNDQILPGAKFALYRTARDGETDLLEIDGGQYYKVADLDTSSTGIAVKDQIEQLEEGEQYYLVETEVPAGYIAISPIPVNLSLSDVFTPKPGTTTQTTKPDSGIYDWTQNASLVLNAESGVKRTNADNTVDLTHSGETANSNNETIYYRITNNPGVELPSTGGSGTLPYTLSGIALIMVSALMYGFRMRRRARRLY